MINAIDLMNNALAVGVAQSVNKSLVDAYTRPKRRKKKKKKKKKRRYC